LALALIVLNKRSIRFLSPKALCFHSGPSTWYASGWSPLKEEYWLVYAC
jgi:hypothetical protein